MYERYRITLKPYPARAPPVPKFVITRAGNCVNCGKCERSCIYGVHKRDEQDLREMADPLDHLCKNCFRCIGECPQGALTMEPGSEYRSLGNGLWTPLRVSTIWDEAETGKIPVFGAGYRGMFTGPGFDGMWTDMSEIVRPTRDGIHGREFISTSVDLGRMLQRLQFGEDGALASELPPLIESQVPVLLDVTRILKPSEEILVGWARAARKLNTFMLLDSEAVPKSVSAELNSHMVPVYPIGTSFDEVELPEGVRMAEVIIEGAWKREIDKFRKRFPEQVISVRLQARDGIENEVLKFVRGHVDVVHLDYDEYGMEPQGKSPRHCIESLRSVHKTLVHNSVRDEVTLLAGGGVAAAEHVPKMIICGADAVTLEKALLVALECRACAECSLDSCPIDIRSVPSDWAEGRVTNLVGAWRDQLLEVLGAMGIREVRRLRGEAGRAIFFEEIEREFFPRSPGGGLDG